MYKLLKDPIDGKVFGAIKDNGGGNTTSFTFNPANTDYQEYLKFLAEGGQPLPADDNGQTPE